MKKTIKKSYLFIVMLTFMIVLFSSLIASIFISPKQALALSNPSSAIQVANGAELYDNDNKSFNNAAILNLKEKLFNKENPTDYVKKHVYKINPDMDTTTYLVNATTINTQVGSETGLVVTLGGYQWIVTSVTLTDINFYSKEDVVVTLYLADSYKLSKFYTNGSASKGNNMYSSSTLRNTLLSSNEMSQFIEGDFATKYLVQPQYIKYQQLQSMRLGFSTYDYGNDALNSNYPDWKPQFNTGGGYEVDYAVDGIKYSDWGKDYIWIPSVYEIGGNYSNGTLVESGWKLSPEQIASKGITTAWTRSAHHNNYSWGYAFSDIDSTCTDASRWINVGITNERGVRPAIHVNLSEILRGLENGVQNPQDLTTSYNENEQTIKSIATATKADWYNKDIYEHADNYINITYSNGANYVKDAGEYWVMVEIKESWTNKIIALVEQEAAKYGWTEAEKQQVIDFRKPKFFGTADTSDANHKESDTVRWIKITINKAEIDFSKVTWSQSEFEYNGQIQSVKITSGLPSFLTAVYDNNAKSAVGEYTASVINFTGSDPNYKTYTSTELANIPQLKHNWKITKKKVAVSWTKKNVTIGDITLPIPRLQVAENLANAIEYKYFRNNNLTNEVSLEQIFAENDISEIKSYYIQAIFTTNPMGFNNTNCIFVVDGNEVNSVSEVFQTGSVINKVEVSLKNNKFTYNGLSQAVELNVAGGGLTASNLVISYTTADGTPLSGAPTNVGRYKVLVGLQSGLDDFMIVGEDTFDYEIESLKIRKPKADQVNIFDAEGFGLSAVANMPTNWKSYFEITVDGNVVDENYKFTKAGKYSIQIAFKNGVNTANGGEVDNVVWEDRDNTTYTITLDIQTLEFEISGWQNGTGNKRPTLVSDEKSEIEKYFDYEIYQVKDGQIIGNVILPTATLKYDTNYQISLKVKNEYKGSVYLKYNGQLVDETETYSFKTEVNPNPSGGDGEDESNGTDGKPNGGNNGGGFGGLINGKMSLLDWILIGIVCFMALLILLMFVLNIKLNKNIKNLKLFREQVSPVNDKNNKDNSEEISDNSQANASVINPYTVKNSDWTFVIKEKDVVNIDLLNAPTDKIMFYAFKEADAKGIKKFQSQLMENIKENQAEQIGDNHSKDSKKSKSKKDNKKQPK